MKKFILLLSIFYIISANSQSITVYYNGATFLSEDTINIPVQTTGESVQVNFDLTNTGTAVYDLMVSKEEIYTAPNAIIQFCFNGSCYEGSVSEESYPIAPGATLNGHDDPYGAFHLLYITPETPNNTLTKITFFNETNSADQTIIYVFFSAPVSVASLTSTSIFKAMPNPASNKVNIQYNFINQTLGNNNKIIITNMMGAVIEKMPVNNISGSVSIDITAYSKGIYLYSLESEGIIVNTKKLIVQ